MKIDCEVVFQMRRQGFTCVEVANRLKCSERQVRRISKQIEKDKNITFKSSKSLKDKDVEIALRDFYSSFESSQETANRFGISRQAILKQKERSL
jgi:DNA-binding CsgD family transcriptional regulator